MDSVTSLDQVLLLHTLGCGLRREYQLLVKEPLPERLTILVERLEIAPGTADLAGEALCQYSQARAPNAPHPGSFPRMRACCSEKAPQPGRSPSSEGT